MRPWFLLLCSPLLLLVCVADSQDKPAWSVTEVGFRPISMAATKTTLWVAGVGEGVASSTDAHHWVIRHHNEGGGELLLGIGFPSETFGYAYGTRGTVMFTADGGATWTRRKLGNDTILQASFSDAAHGLIRTSSGLFCLDADGSLHAITDPADVLHRFPYTASLVALSADRMAVQMSERPYSESGFLATVDGGKTWSFYDPPSTGVASFLRVGDRYWMSGHEVVDKDKPGGGHSVPVAMSSEDGLHWQHTANDVHACHWQICGVCTIAGCLASNTLLVNFFGSSTTYVEVPKGGVTAKWAAIPEHVCSIEGKVSCAAPGTAKNIEVSGVPKPSEPMTKPLNAQPTTGSTLRCIECSIDPVYVDDKVEGRSAVHVDFIVRSDGTLESIDVKDAPSASVKEKIRSQMIQWLFEPPVQDGKSVRVSTHISLTVNVVRSR
jgi:hypothetical protein